MFEMQQHAPIGYDGRQFTTLSTPDAAASFAEYAGDFGSPPAARAFPLAPPSQFHSSVAESPAQSERSLYSPPPYASRQFVSSASYRMGYSTPSAVVPPAFDTSSPKSTRRVGSNGYQTLPRSPPLSSSPNSTSFNRNTSFRSSFRRVQPGADDSRGSGHHSSSFDASNMRAHNRSALPPHTVDAASGVVLYTFEQIMDEGLFEQFAKDKSGCHHLQENYPEENTPLRRRLSDEMNKREKFFKEMCQDVFANFFVQKMIELSNEDEQAWMADRIRESMFELCMNRYSCRVIQKALDVLPEDLKAPLLSELHEADLVTLSVDQNANHVIQKIFNTFDFHKWKFIVVALMKERAFFRVVEDKYGCRVIQLAIELLSSGVTSETMEVVACGKHSPTETAAEGYRTPSSLLHALMLLLVRHCEQFSSNEFANYVIQHVIVTRCLSYYRELIIEQCLLTKLLSLSQEKYASHVVEKAMDNASAMMLREMMDEIFDGYVPHPETKKDALDILLFHQFGNYVVQRMLTICLSEREQRLEATLRAHWMQRLEDRINRNTSKLLRYSSGKKIIDMLRAARGQPMLSTPSPHHHAVQQGGGAASASPRVPDRFR